MPKKNNKRDLLWKFYYHMKHKGLAESTIKSYGSITKNFLLSHPYSAGEITFEMMMKHLSGIESYNTRKQTVAALKMFYREVVGQPRKVEKLSYPKRPRRVYPKVITRKEFETGLSGVKNPKHRLILLLLFGCGLRLGELLNLRTEDLKQYEAANGGLFYALHIRSGKGAKDRIVPCPDRLAERIKTLCPGYVIRGLRGQKYSPSSVRNIVRRAFGVHPHALRHSYATELVGQDVNLKKISDLLGHEKVSTTSIYTHNNIHSLAGITPLNY